MNKTGAKNLLRDTFKKLYPSHWYLFSKANWQFITKTLNELSPNEKQSGLAFNVAVIRDEVSTLAKHMKSGALGTSLEFYSDLMDNQLQEYGTSEVEEKPIHLLCTVLFGSQARKSFSITLQMNIGSKELVSDSLTWKMSL